VLHGNTRSNTAPLYQPEDIDIINWGNGHKGVCLNDERESHSIVARTEY